MGTSDVAARLGGPNVVMIVLDDLGYAQFGCYGSDIQTPAIDRLARNGLRYSRFHVTGLCSPTRAALLTGRNHHAVGMGFLADIPTAHPGYTGKIPASMPRVLRDSGWSNPSGSGHRRHRRLLCGCPGDAAPRLAARRDIAAPGSRPRAAGVRRLSTTVLVERSLAFGDSRIRSGLATRSGTTQGRAQV